METNYFEKSKSRQRQAQIKIIQKIGKTSALPHELADAAHALEVRFFDDVGQSIDTDCKKGCSYCCHQPATVFPFEAIRIAALLKKSLSKEQLGSLKEKMQRRTTAFQGSSVRAQLNNKAACPLLTNGECSVYASRPLTCRLAHSFSVKKCQLSFEKDRMKVQVPMSVELAQGVSGIIEAAFDELPKAGLDANLYELCSAVLVALADPNAAAKWARGDASVFKDCIRDDT